MWNKLTVIVLITIVRAWSIQTAWCWFVAPGLHLEPANISLLASLGVSLTLVLFSSGHSLSDAQVREKIGEDEAFKRSLRYSVLFYLFWWAMALAAHYVWGLPT